MAALTVEEVNERLEADNKGTWDALLEPAEVSLVKGQIVSPRLYRYEYPLGLTPTPWATGQLCQFLGIPTAYFKRCSVELQDMQFNYWRERLVEEQMIERQDKQEQRSGKRNGRPARAERWLIRARNEALRGVLTEKYVRLDNLELFAALTPALSADYEVDWFALSDESFHLRLHDARLFRDALPGDRLMAGVHIGNSEVGKRAVTVDALVYRLVCTNGLIRKVDGQSLLHQRHIGVGKQAFGTAVQQAVREALAFSAAYLERLAAAVAYPIPDVEKTLHKLALDWGLTQATEEAVKTAILAEHPSQHETLYGLINGLTGAARNLPADERYTLEVQAGRLLETQLGGLALRQTRERPNASGRFLADARSVTPSNGVGPQELALFTM
jgi:hypothetical protein